MRKRILSLALAALLLLGGCSSMLDTEGWSVEPHVERPDTAEDSSIPRVETYQQLVNTVFSLVSQGVDQGVIRLYNYTRDVDTDLKNACNEVSQVDPFGSYAVEFMSYDFTRMVKYYQATIKITYLHTPEQIGSMVRVTGTSAIRDILRVKLAQFSPEAVLRVDYFTEDRDYIVSLVRQAYYDTPVAALGMPQINVTLYPNPESVTEEARGSQRVVEIQLGYPEDGDALVRKREKLQAQADALSYSMASGKGRTAAASIYELLRQRVVFSAPSQASPVNTAYTALLENRADSEGGALAFQLLAQAISLESSVVQGKLEGADHFWNVVQLENGDWRHVDSSSGTVLLLTDGELAELGYSWVQSDYPACGEVALQEPDPSAPPSNPNSVADLQNNP